MAKDIIGGVEQGALVMPPLKKNHHIPNIIKTSNKN